MRAMGHNDLREDIKLRITSGEWETGALIPAEEELASEYQCSRTTVNRAIQALADAGMVERRRGAGTRVKTTPVRRAQFNISLVRHEVEAAGATYRHRLILNKAAAAPEYVKNRLHLKARDKALHLQTLHLANGRPHAFEDRWVNLSAAPGIAKAPLDEISANEWLLREVPFSDGEISFTAVSASAKIAKLMEAPDAAALMRLERTTWWEEKFVTTMKLYYKKGYELRTRL